MKHERLEPIGGQASVADLERVFRGLTEQIGALEFLAGYLIAEAVRSSSDPQAAWDRIDRQIGQVTADLSVPGARTPALTTYSLASAREHAAIVLRSVLPGVDASHANPDPSHWTAPLRERSKVG
jgi:hypothetical protein